MDTTSLLSTIGRCIMALISAAAAVVEPVIPCLMLCTGFVFLDCYSAYMLARRVKKVHPEKASGKLRSEKIRHVFSTLIEIYVVVCLVDLAHIHLADELPFNITKIVAGAVCGWQFWSYLENSASCNGAKWAIAAKKIFVDKTSRHFDIDIDNIPNPSNNA